MSERFAGRYLLLKLLGRGGMGEVWLARDLTTGAECALKRLLVRSETSPEKLLREFEALTRVRHPQIVSVYELGFSPEGGAYYTMEYVPGKPADRALERGDWAGLAFVAARVAHGLEALHGAHVVHGDVKPSNILVVPADAPGGLPKDVRLLDFGLAGLLGREGRGRRGTFGYAAPEVVAGGSPSVASDLYGFGATLYLMASGRPAFEGDDATTVIRQQNTGSPSALPLEEAGAPAALVQLVLRLMAGGASERPRDAREVRRELERLHPAARRPLADRLDAVTPIGRERELARLEPDPGDARRARLVLLGGEAGMGKSVLLDAVAARAALARRPVVQLSCALLEGAGQTARALMQRLAAMAESGGDPVDARAVLEGDRPIVEADFETLVAAGVAWTRALAQRSGTVTVLLDDAERLDPLSRALLRRLVLHPEAGGVQWVWAGRTQAEGTLEDDQMLLDAGVAERLELAALEPEAVARLAAARLGEPAPEALRQFLVERAAGHPGMTVELLRAAAATRALRESEAGIVVDDTALERIGVPVSFEGSLLARLEALPSAAGDAALTLALWGRAVPAARLSALDAHLDAAAIEALLRTSLAARDAQGNVRLSPPALAPCVIESAKRDRVDAIRRRLLEAGDLGPTERFRHLRALGELESALDAAEQAMDAQPDPRFLAEVADAAESHSAALAASWHERAAREHAIRGRYASAIPHLERALALEAQGKSQAKRWVQLGLANLWVGRFDDVEHAVTSGLSASPGEAERAHLLAIEASRLRNIGKIEPALVQVKEAVATAERSGDPAANGYAAMILCAVLTALQRDEDADQAALRAAEEFRRAGDLHGALRMVGARVWIAFKRQSVTEAERLGRETLAIARTRGDRVVMEEVLTSLANIFTESGRWEDAREAFGESARISLEDGRARAAAMAIANLAQLDGLTGRAEAAMRQSRAATRLTRSHLPRHESAALRSLAQALRISGRRREAERFGRRAIAVARHHSFPSEIDWGLVEFGRILIGRGRWKKAAEVLEHAIEHRSGPITLGAVVLGTLAGRAALRRGNSERAEDHVASAEAWMEKRTAPYLDALTLQLRAELAIARGRISEGVDFARRALDSLGKLPAPADQAHAALEFARLATATYRDVRAPVGAWLDLAAGAFERLGDHTSRERALARQVRWLRRATLHPVQVAPDRNLIEAVSRLLNSLPDLNQLAQRAMRMAVEQLDAERGVMLVMDETSGELQLFASYGMEDEARARAVGYSRQAVRRVKERGGALIINDAPSDPGSMSRSMEDMGLRSIVCVPLFLEGKVVGAVYLDSRRPDMFTEAHRGMLEGFAQLMAVAIENSRGHEQVVRANEQLVGEILSLRQAVGARYQVGNMVGDSLAMRQVLAVAARAALTSSTVLLTGENGTGKELLARALHHGGKRRDKPFVAVNCGAFPETLIESELFGHVRGAFTGAESDREGRFVQAHGGTLFLDEIGAMPLNQQVKLLSVIANREVYPVGGSKPVSVDVRIIAATNSNLAALVKEGRFREDLFFRLNVIPIEMPPLRDRKADIPALARYFVSEVARQQERPAPDISPEFIATLMRSDWPGNVRELQNHIERAMAMSSDPVLRPSIPLMPPMEDPLAAPRGQQVGRLDEVLETIEKKMLRDALDRANGIQVRAAAELGINEQSIRYKLQKFGLKPRRTLRIRKNQR